MTFKPTRLVNLAISAGCLILAGQLLTSCDDAFMQAAYTPPPPAPVVAADFPNGVIAYLDSQNIPSTALMNVSFHISTDPGFVILDKNTAHVSVPKRFLEQMNTRMGYTRFVEANGTPGHIQITLSFNMDSTQDHAGVRVSVDGFNTAQNVRLSSLTAVHWFSFDLNPYYTGMDTLTDAAANKTMDYILNGWTP